MLRSSADAMSQLCAMLLIGAELASLLTTGSLVPGARIAAGVFGMTGPWGAPFARVAEHVAAAGERSRELTLEEYAWAHRVFAGALPPRERLVLTDTLGAGERAFTFPRSDGTIALNMGPASFADPRVHGSPDEGLEYGEMFVHELAHAWQLDRAELRLSLLADALRCRIVELTGGDPYEYRPGRPFAAYGLEQQAQIVSDWFRRHHRALGSPAARRDPRYRYIRSLRRDAP